MKEGVVKKRDGGEAGTREQERVAGRRGEQVGQRGREISNKMQREEERESPLATGEGARSALAGVSPQRWLPGACPFLLS